MWAVYQRNYRITKQPMTEYDARNTKNHWEKLLSNVEAREIEQPKMEIPKPKKKKRKRSRLCWG